MIQIVQRKLDDADRSRQNRQVRDAVLESIFFRDVDFSVNSDTTAANLFNTMVEVSTAMPFGTDLPNDLKNWEAPCAFYALI